MCEEVNSLIVNRLQVRDVFVQEAVCHQKPSGKDCGVVVAKFATFDTKRKVMEDKSRLGTIDHYQHIIITHDKPKWRRQHEATMRMVIRTLGNRLYLKGAVWGESR